MADEDGGFSEGDMSFLVENGNRWLKCDTCGRTIGKDWFAQHVLRSPLREDYEVQAERSGWYSGSGDNYCDVCISKAEVVPPSQCARSLKASDPIRADIHSIIRRYGQESDVTVYQAIGVLEVVKMDLMDMLERARKDE